MWPVGGPDGGAEPAEPGAGREHHQEHRTPAAGRLLGGCGAGIIDANAAVTAAINGGGNPNPGGNVLQNNVPVTGLGAATGAELNYRRRPGRQHPAARGNQWRQR